MIIVKKDTTPIADECILLGRQCENEARQIEFDLSWLIDEYGSGTAVLVHQRNKDVAPYICTTTQSDNILTWTLDNQDTVYDGWGQAELRWSVGDVLAKTLIYKTMVIRSITADTTIPEPLESWYDEMIDYIDEHGIDPEDLAAAIAAYLDEHPVEAPVQSVNNKTGAVVLTASDVGAGTYSKPINGIPASDLASGVVPPVKNVWTGTCTTGASTETKAVTIDDSSWSSPSAGTMLVVYFRYGNSHSTPKISINGGTASVIQIATGYASIGNVSAPYNKWGTGIRFFVYYSNKWVMAFPDYETLIELYAKIMQDIPVTSVNNKTGAVTLNASDVGAGTYSKPSGGIPKTDLSSAVQTSLGKADTALQSAPVTSVNTKTGAVSLDAGDLGYDGTETYSSDTVGKAITDLNGDLNGKLDAPSTAGTNGQVLTSDGQGGQSWQTPQSGGSVSPYTSNPEALGTASAGSSDDYARGDHVHPMPSAANVGAIASPSSPSSGDFLVYNGTAWVAQSLSTWQGGSY